MFHSMGSLPPIERLTNSLKRFRVKSSRKHKSTCFLTCFDYELNKEIQVVYDRNRFIWKARKNSSILAEVCSKGSDVCLEKVIYENPAIEVKIK